MSTMNQSNLYINDAEEQIVISGMAGRFPNTDNLKDLQENLLNKMDLGSNDHGRWINCFNMPHRIGKINNIEKFDSQFFNMSAEEADTMDPAARILLEHTYEAIVDAGVNPKELRGTRTAVFAATSTNDSEFLIYHKFNGLPMIGCSKALMANRISHWLGVTGPSYNIDTACSSSHLAMMEAYRVIRSGQCDAAVVTAVNICLHPYVNFGFYCLGVLSSDGYCKPFDEEGTGYMRSDTGAVVFLQKARDARRVYATFVHCKSNCDGYKEEGITFPSFDKQTTLMKEFYEESGISPDELAYLEAHATGTIVGDPVEIKSIDQAICAKRKAPLLIGSIKSNLGHPEAASGFCQIAKVILAMETGIITPTIHLKSVRKDLSAIIEGRIKVITQPTKFEGGYVGINSFGFGGANCHILLKSNPKEKINNGTPTDDLPRLVVVSGCTEEAVEIILDNVQDQPVDAEYISLLHHIYLDDIEGHHYRGYMITGPKKSYNTVSKVENHSNIRRPICFILSGLGSEWFGMGRALIKFSVFAKAIEKCDTVLRPYGICLIDILTSGDKSIFDNIVNLFLGLVGLQIGLIDLLTSIGIVPDFIISHTIGELICGYADGCLTAEETIQSAYFIGLALHESNIINGSMAEISLDNEAMRNMCPSDVDIASYNSSSNFIASGPIDSVKAFLIKLQANNISAKEISCGYIPFHSRYVRPAAVKCEKYLNRILPQGKFPSSKWLSASIQHECSDAFPTSCSKYYTNQLLSPVLFANGMRSLPRDAVTIEIASRNILRYILKDPLHSTVTNVALYADSEDYSAEIFLETIGKLYNAGLQPRIANLYPKVEFPVSRGTPMISPLIRWDHSKDFFVMQYSQQKIEKREMAVNIDVADEEFIYLLGHVVNDKNLFPATAYLFLVWQMIASLRNQEYTDVPVVFEDVTFIRATVLSKEVELTLMIQEGSNRFEIIEGNNAVVTGTVRISTNIEDEKIPTDLLAKRIDEEEEMSTRDIYKELRLRGYQYTGIFRGLKSASVTGSNGHIAWTCNWVAFIDNMIQMMILGQNLRNLLVPTRIRKLIIDPKYHIQLIENDPIEERQFSVRSYKSIDAIISGGVEISGIVAAPISRRQKAVNTVLEEYRFVAHRDLAAMPLRDAIRISVHVALECCNMINVKVIEFIEDSDEVASEDLNSLLVDEILSDLPQIRHHTRLVTSRERFQDVTLSKNVSITEVTKLSRDENCLLVIGFGILTKNSKKLYKNLLSILMPQGFLLTLEEPGEDCDYSCLKEYGLEVILEKRTDKKALVLLRKAQHVVRNRQIVRVNNYEFSWIDELKSLMSAQNEANMDMRIILVAEEDSECGLLGLVNCLRKELGGEVIRGVFIQDDRAPAFSLQEPLYTQQLQLDLPINIIRSGNVWGSYRHFLLPSPEPKLVPTAYVMQTVQGDLSTLCWVQSKIPSHSNREDIVNVIYAPVNFKDIMLTTGRITAASIGEYERDNNTLIGMEFAGFNTRGQRLMGLCSYGGMTNICVANKYLTWIVPDNWTMEEAATIPCVYSTCYFALYISGKIKKGDRVLIHSGTGGIGQAAIHLALYEGCEVFTTVGSVEKRQFIRETFPSIPEDHIGNSRDTSFEQMIIQRTGGRGVDIVLNSLAEEKLQASVRCLANGGRFLEIGKFDMVANNPLDISVFSKGINFYGVLLDKILMAKPKRKTDLWEGITKGLENGSIKPLCRKIFDKDEVETAFRYMAAGKHIGKIIIKTHEENEPLDAPLLAYPRYYCLEHKCYIILGGLGGFGLELANWLISRGAKNLVLTSRTGIRTGYQQSRIKLWRSCGVNVQIVTVGDVMKHEDCESILKLAEETGPVDAIFNLAVVLKDCTFQNQSAQTFEDSFKAKAWLTKKMDVLSRTVCPQLRYFVVFSSVSCGRGNAGQTNYGMANSVMERICEKRMEEGLHGLAIQWGAIGDVGLVADMQEDNKELVIGGTLQQRISSCLDTLEMLLLQDRPIVSSMVVAEKGAGIGGSMNIYETIAHIMGLKDINTVAQNVSLAELGMDSMMAVEIKQTLEREFDILLTTQDIRNLNFGKLKQMADTAEQGKMHVINKIDTNNSNGLEMLIRVVKDSDLVPDILVELATKREVGRDNIFLLPGVEGCSSVYKSIAAGIKSPAMCLQHGVLNIPNQSRSVMKSAAYLLPHVLEKMKDQKEFLIVGYSFGSLIAIELARLLEAKNISGRLILIDGAPDQMKFWVEQYFFYTSQEELQNIVLLGLMDMYNALSKEMLALELSKCDTWEDKLEKFNAYFPNVLTMENQKIICTTIYDRIIAIQDYNVSSLPRLKSPISLLKPTRSVTHFTEEDYGLHKITEGKVQIHYVEGTHVTMIDNDKILSDINEEWMEE